MPMLAAPPRYQPILIAVFADFTEPFSVSRQSRMNVAVKILDFHDVAPRGRYRRHIARRIARGRILGAGQRPQCFRPLRLDSVDGFGMEAGLRRHEAGEQHENAHHFKRACVRFYHARRRT